MSRAYKTQFSLRLSLRKVLKIEIVEVEPLTSFDCGSTSTKNSEG